MNSKLFDDTLTFPVVKYSTWITCNHPEVAWKIDFSPEIDLSPEIRFPQRMSCNDPIHLQFKVSVCLFTKYQITKFPSAASFHATF